MSSTNKRVAALAVVAGILASTLGVTVMAKNNQVPKLTEPTWNRVSLHTISALNSKQQEPKECVRKLKDPIKLKGATDPKILSLTVGLDGDGNEEIVAQAPQGALAIYSDTDPTNFGMMAFPVGDQPIELPIAYFTPGTYTAIATTEPNACQSFTEKECKKDSNYLAAAKFTIRIVDNSMPVCQHHKQIEDAN